MPVMVAVLPGRLVDSRWWCCPNCPAKLGELIGNRVVIRFDARMISMALDTDPRQTCPKCGTESRPPEAPTHD